MNNNKYERRPHGVIEMAGIETMHTRQCVHCGMHWRSITQLTEEEYRRGFHKPELRGECFRCMGPTCGPGCTIPPGECMPWEQVNELIHQGVLTSWMDPKLKDREFYHRNFFQGGIGA